MRNRTTSSYRQYRPHVLKTIEDASSGGVTQSLGSQVVGWMATNMYHPMAYGAKGDGTTDDEPVLDGLVNTTMSAGGWVLIDRSYKVNNDFTVPTGVNLWITENGRLVVPNDVTVSVLGSVNAGKYQIFDTSFRGNVILRSSGQAYPAVSVSYPEWWGIADGVDASRALRQCFRSSRALPVLLSGQYRLQAPVYLPNYAHLVGTGNQSPVRLRLDETFYPNRVQMLLVNGTGGTYTLTYSGQTTGALNHNADASTIQAALEALSTIDAGTVEVSEELNTSPNFRWLIEFDASHGAAAAVTIADSTSGGTGATVTACHFMLGNRCLSGEIYAYFDGLQFYVLDSSGSSPYVNSSLYMLHLGGNGAGILETSYLKNMGWFLSDDCEIAGYVKVEDTGPYLCENWAVSEGSAGVTHDYPIFLHATNGLSLRNVNYNPTAAIGSGSLESIYIRAGSWCQIEGMWCEKNPGNDIPLLYLLPRAAVTMTVRGLNVNEGASVSSSGNSIGVQIDFTDHTNPTQVDFRLEDCYMADMDIPVQILDTAGDAIDYSRTDFFLKNGFYSGSDFNGIELMTKNHLATAGSLGVVNNGRVKTIDQYCGRAYYASLTGISGDGATATVTVASVTTSQIAVGQRVAIAGTTNFNGTYTITAVNAGANTFAFAHAYSGSEATGTYTRVIPIQHDPLLVAPSDEFKAGAYLLMIGGRLAGSGVNKAALFFIGLGNTTNVTATQVAGDGTWSVAYDASNTALEITNGHSANVDDVTYCCIQMMNYHRNNIR